MAEQGEYYCRPALCGGSVYSALVQLGDCRSCSRLYCTRFFEETFCQGDEQISRAAGASIDCPVNRMSPNNRSVNLKARKSDSTTDGTLNYVSNSEL